MSSKDLKGKDLMLFINNKPIALATECSISINANYNNTSTKDSGIWDGQILQSISWTASSSNLEAKETKDTELTYNALFKLLIAGAPVDVVVGVSTNHSDDGVPEEGWIAPTKGMYKGKAVIATLERNAPKDGSVTLSISLTGDGNLALVEDTI